MSWSILSSCGHVLWWVGSQGGSGFSGAAWPSLTVFATRAGIAGIAGVGHCLASYLSQGRKIAAFPPFVTMYMFSGSAASVRIQPPGVEGLEPSSLLVLSPISQALRFPLPTCEVSSCLLV